MSEAQQIAAERARQAQVRRLAEIDRAEQERRSNIQQGIDRAEQEKRKQIQPDQRSTIITRFKQPELSQLGKISKTYEAQFQKVSDRITKGITASKSRAVTAKLKGQPIQTVANFALGTAGSATKGAFNAVTFPVRPVQWKNTATAVSQILTPEKGESQAAYKKRITNFVNNDVRDKAEAKRITNQILKVLPSPPTSGLTKEERETAKKYREVVAKVITDDPIAFIAETVGGLAGGYIAGKLIAKLPDAIKKITPKTLEQRAFAKLRPLGKIDDAVGIQAAIGQSPAKLLPTGKWSKINQWVPKQRRGFTSIVVLVDPVSKVIKGVITLKEAQAMTGGIPELLTSMGGLQAIPMVKLDQDVSQDVREELNRLNASKSVLIPVTVQKQLDEEEELLDQLGIQGIIVIPDIDDIQDIEDIQDIIDIQDIDEIQDPITDPITEQVLEPLPPTPPIILRKKDRKLRNSLNLRLFRGAKSMFRVTYTYNKTKKEIVTVEARSFPEAINKAQRKRKTSKKEPKLVDLVKIR